MEPAIINNTNNDETWKSKYYENNFSNPAMQFGLENDAAENRLRIQGLMVGLFGLSMSLCAFSSHPVELELEDDEVTQQLSNVSFARRITKPTIRILIGCGKMSAIITGFTSLLLLIAVMSKQSWWQHGPRWLFAPAILVLALEASSDAGDAVLATLIKGSDDFLDTVEYVVAAIILVTTEILVW